MAQRTVPVDERLRRHLASWVGEWPPPAPGVTVVGDPARTRPTWDGAVRPLQGVGDGHGTVICVPPDRVESVRSALAAADGDGDGDGDRPGLGDRLGRLLGIGPARYGHGVFRTTSSVDPTIEELGEWCPRQTDDLPDWLAPFNGPRLVARDDEGRVVAGVGIKVHDEFGHEIAVVTDPAAEGRGLARRLVATAARRILDDGAVPTYLHQESNAASAHVAEAVGFADRGWTVHGLWPRG